MTTETPAAVPEPAFEEPEAAPVGRRDEMEFTLSPGQGAEVKLVMNSGARANFAWSVSGGVVNYDTHGDGGGQSTSYEKGRSVPGGQGVLEAAFTGNHGWFWRNRGTSDVTVTLMTEGDYSEIKRVIQLEAGPRQRGPALPTVQPRTPFSVFISAPARSQVARRNERERHFGVNDLGLITVFAKDIGRLDPWEQRIWSAHNVTPDGGPSRELVARADRDFACFHHRSRKATAPPRHWPMDRKLQS